MSKVLYAAAFVYAASVMCANAEVIPARSERLADIVKDIGKSRRHHGHQKAVVDFVDEAVVPRGRRGAAPSTVDTNKPAVLPAKLDSETDTTPKTPKTHHKKAPKTTQARAHGDESRLTKDIPRRGRVHKKAAEKKTTDKTTA